MIRIHRRNSNPERGTVFVEMAITVPFLLTLVFGVVFIGKLFSQITWLISTSYEGIAASSQAIEYSGTNETYRIKNMFEGELNNDMQSVTLAHQYIDDTSTGVSIPIVKVGLSGDIFPVTLMGTAGLSVDLTGPHIGKGYGITGNSTFATLNGPYGCNGITCGEVGAETPCPPTAPC